MLKMIFERLKSKSSCSLKSDTYSKWFKKHPDISFETVLLSNFLLIFIASPSSATSSFPLSSCLWHHIANCTLRATCNWAERNLGLNNYPELLVLVGKFKN